MFLVTLLPKVTFLTFLLGLLLGCNSQDSNSNEFHSIPQIMEALQNISHRITNLESSLMNEKNQLLGEYQKALSSREEKCSSLLSYLKQNLSSEIEKMEATLLDTASDLGSQLTTHNAEFLENKEEMVENRNPNDDYTTDLPSASTLLHGKNTFASTPSHHSEEYSLEFYPYEDPWY